MVVEDDDDAREFLVHSLEILGAHVMSASRAANALEYLRAVRPAVLVGDLSMPDQDGFDLLRAVRWSSNLSAMPAIAVTGHGVLRSQAEQSGYQRSLKKPIDPLELCRVIGELTRGGRAAGR